MIGNVNKRIKVINPGKTLAKRIAIIGSKPKKDTHLPPNLFLIGLFNLSAIKYIAGTISKVIKNANAKPKIIVHERGFQNTTLSPPKKI